MPTVHCITVGQGDCTILEHGSGRVSMIDICGGNLERETTRKSAQNFASRPRGNYGMCKSPTNPLDYLDDIGVSKIWRFISTHPDMDHLDGFDRLIDEFEVCHFWDSGARKDKPDFEGSPYLEADWDRYVKVRDGDEENTSVVKVLEGKSFKYANEDEKSGHGDYVTICAPTAGLIDDCNDRQEFNDASYIIVYRAKAGKVVLCGDADDEAWNCALDHHPDLLRNVGFLLAPHHGRDSGRDWSFLSHLNPRLSLLGCAPSEYLAYDAWNKRGLNYFTQNQCGNFVIDAGGDRLDVYIENEKFASDAGGDTTNTNHLGYFYLGSY